MNLEAIDHAQVTNFAKEFFDINAYAEPLCSYAGRNYLLSEKRSSTKYILKISEPEESYENLEAQHAMMHHLMKKELPFLTPSPLKASDHREILPVPESEGHYMRILSYIPGKFLCDLNEHPKVLLEQWGACMAKVDQALRDFYHHGFNTEHIWDYQNIPKQMDKSRFCKQPRIRKIIDYYFAEYLNTVAPRLNKLRKSIIHNDGNDYNIVAAMSGSQHSISGLIDFGDAVYSYPICELAVAASYAMLHKREPLDALQSIVKGYHQNSPLNFEEIELLPTLIGARLALSISFSSYEYELNPDNPYILVSQKGAKNLLNQMIRFNPKKIVEMLCSSCAIENKPKNQYNYGQLISKRKKLLGPNLSLSEVSTK